VTRGISDVREEGSFPIVPRSTGNRHAGARSYTQRDFESREKGT